MERPTAGLVSQGKPPKQVPRIGDLVIYLLRLGTFGFGGPVALCRIFGSRLLGIIDCNRWNFSTFNPAHPFCRPDLDPQSQQFDRARVRQRGLRGGHWHDLRSLCAVG